MRVYKISQKLPNSFAGKKVNLNAVISGKVIANNYCLEKVNLHRKITDNLFIDGKWPNSFVKGMVTPMQPLRLERKTQT